MPFERYLRHDDGVVNRSSDPSYYYQSYGQVGNDDADCRYAHGRHPYLPEAAYHDYHHPHAVQFQIPQFMFNGPPKLAPGGGAEVLPAGLLDNAADSFTSSWFANSGFGPFHSSLISRQFASGATPPDSANPPSFRTFCPDGSQCLPPYAPSRFPGSVDLREQTVQEPSPSREITANYIPDIAPPQSPYLTNPTSYAAPNLLASDSVPSFPVISSSGLGLPVYSASGFDVLSILSRIVSRPNPAIHLGPVDLSCSFVIVDVRRYDSPIVYASPTFCHLTGYSEQEILGRNCRFLQSPTGNVAKGEPRRSATQEAVSYMRKLLSSSKECQTTLINYRKGGQAFINLVTVIPLRGGVHNTPAEADEVAYHVGFQADLTEQPARILDKLRDGSYYPINGSWGGGGVFSNGGLSGMGFGLGPLAQVQNMTNIGLKGGRHAQMMSIAVSKELRNLIADTTFTDSVLITTGTSMPGPTTSSSPGEQGTSATTPLTMFVSPPSGPASMNRMSSSGNTTAESISVSLSPSLSLLLLEFLPDFLLVLSLKGSFLYVAPSVRLVLGYEAQELVGRGISDVCHPADLVPLMRELKEGSVSGLNVSGAGDVGPPTIPPNLLPRSVDLLFRALPKTSPLSPLRKTPSASAEQGNCHSFQSSSSSSSTFTSTSASQSSSSPTCSSDPLEEAAPHVWLECRGRLHVEPGKGRKAIILSGRARWMPVVRWGSVDKAGGVGSIQNQGDSTHGVSHITAGSKLRETPSAEPVEPLIDPSEFWALLSSQGTFLVASASVRDVLGWGTSEVIGRSICVMVRDSRGGMREHVEAELAKLDTLEMSNMVDPPPSIVTTSLVHRESHTVPMRLAFYRTPRPDKRAPFSGPSIYVTPTPLIHPLNNPLCPIVCQATVLTNAEYHSSKNNDTSFASNSGRVRDRVQVQMDSKDDDEETGSLTRSSVASIFEELETVRSSSWQYELQQLKFANQRLYEELHALEGACVKGSTGTESSSGTTRHNSAVRHAESCLSSTSTAAVAVPPQPQLPQTPLHYTPFTALSSLRQNGLHEHDTPPSGWSSLAGANGQGPNPLKRSWRSEDGSTT